LNCFSTILLTTFTNSFRDFNVNSGEFELGLAIVAAITVFNSLLGVYLLVKTKIASLKTALIVSGLAISLWVLSVIAWFFLSVPMTIIIETITVYMILLLGIFIYIKSRKMKSYVK